MVVANQFIFNRWIDHEKSHRKWKLVYTVNTVQYEFAQPLWTQWFPTRHTGHQTSALCIWTGLEICSAVSSFLPLYSILLIEIKLVDAFVKLLPPKNDLIALAKMLIKKQVTVYLFINKNYIFANKTMIKFEI